MTNILLITADDMDGQTPGHFGGIHGATPALDRLAREGIAFRRSHVAVAVCQPSRSAIMTGMWPHRNGAEGFEPIHNEVGLFTDLLHKAGYLAGILGKTEHLQPVERFGWDFLVPMSELGLGRSPQAYGAAADSFFKNARHAAKPWFLMANAHDPHRPFHASAAETEKWSPAQRGQYPAPSRTWTADEVDIPGFLPSLPEVREEYAQYLSSARRCDDVVAAVLAALERNGYAEDTLVVFLSDNGMAFPFAKANCYLRSTLTPLIVRWPGVTRPGTIEEEAFVSSLDLFPTFCDAIGVQTPVGLDGVSLTPLLRRQAPGPRASIFTVFHETSAKVRYEMRCVQDARWGYIWNAWSDGEQTYRAENMEGLSWQAMLQASTEDGAIAERTGFYLRRAPEELYDLSSDPNCLINLAGDPGEAARALEACRQSLATWMRETQDPLTESFAALLTQHDR